MSFMPLRWTLMSLTAALCVACGNAQTDTPPMVDASSKAKLHKSVLRIEQVMTEDKKVEFARAMNIIKMRPESGSCDVKDVLAHAQKFQNSSFEQRVSFTRLHGLTAEEIIGIAKERNCSAEINEQTQ